MIFNDDISDIREVKAESCRYLCENIPGKGDTQKVLKQRQCLCSRNRKEAKIHDQDELGKSSGSQRSQRYGPASQTMVTGREQHSGWRLSSQQGRGVNYMN